MRLTGAVTEKGVSTLECGVLKAEREREKKFRLLFAIQIGRKLETGEYIIYWAWSVS